MRYFALLFIVYFVMGQLSAAPVKDSNWTYRIPNSMPDVNHATGLDIFYKSYEKLISMILLPLSFIVTEGYNKASIHQQNDCFSRCIIVSKTEVLKFSG